MIYYFLAFELVLFFVVYFFESFDILSPPCIVLSIWIFSTVCAICNISVWGVSLSLHTVLIYAITLLCFSAVCLLTNRVTVKNKKVLIMPENTSISFSLPWIKILTLISIFNLILVTYSVWSSVGISGLFGNQDYSQLMSDYRSSDSSLPSYVKPFFKISKCFSYVCLYMLCKYLNYCKKIQLRTVLRYLFPVISFCLSTLVTGSRTSTMHLFIAFLVIYYVIMKRKSNWNTKNNIKFIIKIMIGIFVFFLFFSNIRFFVGRLNNSDPFYYITCYAGGSIQLFDLYITNHFYRSSQFGQLSFYALWKNIESLGLGKWQPTGLEFFLSNGIQIGNVATSIRRYYQDFGMLGNIILQSFMALFFSVFYKRIKSNAIKSDVSILIYSLIVPSLFLHSIDDIFYAGFFCIDTVVCSLIIVFLFMAVVEKRIKLR